MNTRKWKWGNILLAAIATALLAAQFLIPAHSLEHEPGFAQGQLCAVCAAAAQLAAACFEHPHAAIPLYPHTQSIDKIRQDLITRDLLCVRQRGPPAAS